jgi:hypothetical protein
VDLAVAMGIPAESIVSASIENSDPGGVGIGTGPLGGFFPRQGSTFAILSTGFASTAGSPDSSGSTSTALEGLNNSQGNDVVQLRLTLAPPVGATCLAFDTAFYSEEFPEFVHSQFNDAFTAEIGGSDLQIINNQVVSPLNFAFDTEGNPVSVNTVFGVSPDTGTTYDGATPVLRAFSPLEPSEFNKVELVLTIQDLGDPYYDSAVFLDNFAWLFGANCSKGAQADSDGDALLDVWETNGIDVDNDGLIDLDLPAMGADPKHKDIFIEVDYMSSAGICILDSCLSDGHPSHKPKDDALKSVIEAFDKAPVPNPDGTQGIRLHIDAGPKSLMNHPVTKDKKWGDLSESNALPHDDELGEWITKCGTVTEDGGCREEYKWDEFDQIKAANFSISRRDVFHYVVFAHKLGATGTSGISRSVPSSDFIVSLGSWTNKIGTNIEQAGTLMHELGHNLGLKHGGDDNVNFKPNYLSVMNYSFQTHGLRVDNVDANLDYSAVKLPDLVESSLDETVGIFNFSPVKIYGTRYYCNGIEQVDNDARTVDWNCNNGLADEISVSQNINKEGDDKEVLQSYNDWKNIRFDGGAVGKLGQTIELPLTTEANEITVDEDALIATPYAVSVKGPGDLFVTSGAALSYEFEIANRGENADTYSLNASSALGWADVNNLPGNVTLDPGHSAVFHIPTNIPATAPIGTQDELVLKAVSTTNPLLVDSVTTLTTINNFPPTANAGPDQTVTILSTVTLNGTASADPDNNPLGFAWTQVGGPPVALSDAGAPAPSFRPTAPGVYTFNLVVNDGQATSAADTAAVAVQDTPLLLLGPNGGEVFTVGDKVNIQWYSSGIDPKKKLKLKWSKNGGAKWKAFKKMRNTGGIAWKLKPKNVTDQARLMICLPRTRKTPEVCDTSDANFTIQGKPGKKHRNR